MWYVLKCRDGQEETIIRSCRKHLSPDALDDAFFFRCERLWRSEGMWKAVEKDMFPGYIFLESSRPELLSEEMERYRSFLKVMEEPGYLISVYREEEENLRSLCGECHVLPLSYGYRDRESGQDRFIRGPLKGKREQILKIDWHRRYAKMELFLARRRAVIWAGIGLDESKGEEQR